MHQARTPSMTTGSHICSANRPPPLLHSRTPTRVDCQSFRCSIVIDLGIILLDEQTIRLDSRNPRPADSQDHCSRTDAWLGYRETHSTGEQRRPAGNPGSFVSRAASVGAAGLGPRGVARERERARSEVLRAYESRTNAA